MSQIGLKPWSPSEISPNAWYDAADSSTITATTQAVSQWNDKSGNGNNVSQVTGSKQPITNNRQQNNINVVDFDNASVHCLNNLSPSTTPVTSHDFYFVAKRDSLNDSESLLTLDGSGNAQIRINRFADYNIEVVNDADSQGSRTYSSGDTEVHIFNYRYTGSVVTIFVDGVEVVTPVALTGNVTIDASIRLGSSVFGTNTHNGFIGEVIWSQALSDADRQKMEGYLAWKWGLVGNLATNHPFKYQKPDANSTGSSLWTPSNTTTAAWYDASDDSTITHAGTLVSQLGVLDLTANSGNNPHTGVAWAAGDTYRLAFVSSIPMDATSSDIEHYNMHVQNVAAAAGYGAVTWKAIVSTSAVSAKKNIGFGDPDGAIVNMIGTTFPATSWDDLFDGTVNPKIAYDENGNGPGLADLPTTVPFYQFTPAWTGIDNNGNTENPVGGSTVNFGIAEAEATFQFDRGSSSSTTAKMHIYAISEPLTVQYSSNAISQWNDKSGNANHATQGTGADQPLRSTRTIGGLGTIEGTDDDLFFDTATGFFSAQDDWSMFAVYQDDDYAEGGANDMLIQNLDGTGTGRSLIYRAGGNSMTTFLGGTATALYAQPSTPSILSVTFDWNGSTTSIASWLNGSAGGTGSVSTEANTSSNIRLMGDKPGTACWDGIVGEIIIVNSAVSTADRQKIEGYLAWKWGFPHKLPRSHPYAGGPPTV